MTTAHAQLPRNIVAIDIETGSLKQDAQVFSIGVAWMADGIPCSREIRVLNDLFDDMDLLPSEDGELLVSHQPGRRIDQDTANWWRSPATMTARNHLQKSFIEAMPLATALVELSDLLGGLGVDAESADPEGGEIWVTAIDLDCAVLRHAFDQHGLRQPWYYRRQRCLRTYAATVAELVGFERLAGIDAQIQHYGAHQADADALHNLHRVAVYRQVIEELRA